MRGLPSYILASTEPSGKSPILEKLLLATNNRDKIEELKSLLRGIPLEIVSADDMGFELTAKEDGSTFRENAIIKALAGTRESGLLTLADDSGLEVEALGGGPGVRSARYAGENASNEDRINLLLSRLEGVPLEKRKAAFKSVIALAKPHGEVKTFTGSCLGIIAFKPRGTGGFGYDPVFFLPEKGKTMAELTMEEKNKISHRARAVMKAKRWIIKHYENQANSR